VGKFDRAWRDIAYHYFKTAITVGCIFQIRSIEVITGTVFYERVKSQLSTKSNWEHSDDLELMYRQTFSKAYYRKLHRYTHSFFRLEQARRESLVSMMKYPRMIRYTLQKKYYQHLMKRAAYAD